jgi:hypothetical protein
MADVSGKFFSAVKVRTGVSPSSPGSLVGEPLEPVNPPGGGLNSVGITMPSAFAVANSPLTSNGTIEITGAGTIAQYVRGDGTLETFPSLTGFVPYTGATQNVDLGEFGIDAGFVQLDTTPTNTPTAQGTIFWDVDDETVDVVLNGYIMKIGEDQFYPVKNQTGSSIAKGTAVRFAGTVGASGRLLIAPFIADGSVSSSFFMGVTAEAIADGADGKVLYFGRIRGINTDAFNEGDVLYASTTVAGGFQTAVPVAPNNIVQVAAVITKSINQGVIFIRPSFGSNINQDEGVKIVSPTTGQLLQLQANGLWENKTKAQVLGGTSAQFVKGDGTLDSNTYQVTSEKGEPNGYASLDSNGKVPLVQINDALIGNVNFQGLWNASTNTPTLANPPASGTKGHYYIVSTAGTFASISFEVGDWIISDGTAWGKVDNTDAVSSVFGRTGNVVAANGDYTTAQVTESGNLYYTDGRARGALSFVAGSGAYNSSTGVITIPTNNNQITNGAGYITSAALGGYVQGSGSAGQVAYWSSGSAITGESNLFWDATNDKLGIGTNTFGEKLSVYGSSGVDSFGFFSGGTGTTLGGIKMGNGGNTYGSLYFDNGSNDVTLFQQYISGSLRFGTNSIVKMILTQNGRLLIGNAPPTESTFALDVNGTGQFSGSVTASSFIKSGGTSSQFLKADGSVDSTTYVPIGRTITINGTTQDLSANRTFNVGTVTSVTASSPLFSSGGATPNITIQQSSGSQNGFLSSTDWTTFNNKQNALTNPVTGTGVNGRVAFWNATNTITSDSDLLFNGNTLTLLTGNVEIAAGNGLILFNPNTTNYFQLYTNNGNELNFGFGGTTPVVAKISSSGTMTLTGDIFIQKAAPSVQLRAGNSSNAAFILANSSNTHNWTFESDFGAAGQQGELRIRNSILGSNAITISTLNAATFSSSVNIGASATTGKQLIVNQTGASGYFLSGEASGTEIGYWYYDASQIQFSSKSATRALTFLTSDTERMRITSAGLISINSGITDYHIVSIKSNSTNTYGGFGVYSSSNDRFISMNHTGTEGFIETENAGSGVMTPLSFKTSGQIRLSIATGGNVGIGTASVTTGKLVVKSGESNSTGIVLERGDNTDKLVNIFSETADGKISISSGAATRIFLDSVGASYFTGGNVLIGTTTTIGPAAGRVDILYSGLVQYGMNIRSSHTDGIAISFVNSSGSQVGTIYQNSTSTAYNTSSDYRLKTDFKDFNGVEIINKIKTYDFEWKTDKTRSYGVIAHELKEVIDYAVYGKKDSVTMQGVDYSKLVPIMVKAIQELKQEIDTLKN